MKEILKPSRIPMQLQYFADMPAGGEPAGGAPSGGQGADPPANTPTLDELLKNPAFKTAYDTQQQAAITAARTQWEKDQGLTADEKAAKAQTDREEALNKREGDIAKKELRGKALDELSGKKLPSSLVDALDLTDDKTLAASLPKVEAAFRDSLKAALAEQLKGDPPKAGGAPASDGTRKDAIKETLYGAPSTK